MFAKLAFKNIKRSIKDYAIYFFTLVLGVAIFYVFNALGSQTIMLDVSDRIRDMLDLMNVILGTVSVFVSFILGALIIYASRFLIKRRSKEFGIYLTLGMSKRKISLILLLETFFIGILSLGVGLLLGIAASQLTSVLVANMFDANLTNFHFVFSASAFIKTLIYFGIIYLIVMIFNTIIISRQKLINLLSNSRRNEKVKLKNLWLCTFVFIVAAVMLGIAYYQVTAGLESLIENSDGPEVLLVPIVMGVTATFLLFWSLSGILLRIFMSFKKVYYNKLNSFVLRQFSSKINTTVASMSLICLMLFVTICVLGSALSINHTLHQAIEENLPVDVQVSSIGDSAIGIENIYERESIDINQYLDDVVTYKKYVFSNFAVVDGTNQAVNNTSDDQGLVEEFSSAEEFVHVSDYNRVAKIFHLPEIELSSSEYAIVANYPQVVALRNKALASGKKIQIDKTVLTPKYDKCIDGTIQLEMSNLNVGVIIVPDNINFDDSGDSNQRSYQREYLLANYKNSENIAEADTALESIDRRFFTENGGDPDGPDARIYYYDVETKQEIIDNNVGTSALVTFVGLYLGVIFLISSAAVLALKELSESSDNRDKFTILRKTGASNNMLNRALFWQIFIFFLFPLVIAILHSVFGLMFCDYILSTVGGVDITGSIPWVAGLLALIYGGYFLITYLCSKNIIREQRN